MVHSKYFVIDEYLMESITGFFWACMIYLIICILHSRIPSMFIRFYSKKFCFERTEIAVCKRHKMSCFFILQTTQVIMTYLICKSYLVTMCIVVIAVKNYDIYVQDIS